MHTSVLNFISRRAFLILHKKNRRRNGNVSDNCKKKRIPSIVRSLYESKICEVLKNTSELCHFHFLESASFIPELEECFYEFEAMYPAYQSTIQIDHLRSNDYFHLNKPDAKVCLDYCGFGLFSYLQGFHRLEFSAFTLSETNYNLRNHALFGSALEGTAENDIRTKILDYLNTPDNEYSLVFTATRGSSFRLLAESYPFEKNKMLLTMFDHESQSVSWMARRAREKGAKAFSAKFKWPTLKVCNSEMIKLLSRNKRRKRGSSATGLFVFPVQSRVSGVKYDFKWMALAKQCGWHVLLDAGSLGPKDMESLGLLLYRPDFIITSFYKVFGSDPTGFGCLLIKKSSLSCLQNQSSHARLGMVKIESVYPKKFDGDHSQVSKEDSMNGSMESMLPVTKEKLPIPVFSGPYAAIQVSDSNENGIDETDSVGKMMTSPIFTHSESTNSPLWIYLGQSPSCLEYSGEINSCKKDSKLPFSLFFDAKNHEGLPTDPFKDNLICDKDLNLMEKGSNEDPQISMIQEEAIELQTSKSSTGELKASCSRSTFQHHKSSENDLTSQKFAEITEESYECSTRRETEFELALSGKHDGVMNSRTSTCLDNARKSQSLNQHLGSWEPSSNNSDDDNEEDEGIHEHDQNHNRREPEIICKHIDHINMIGLNKASLRLQYLIDWLIASLLHLWLPGSNEDDGVPLICIYGPNFKCGRGASLAFNVRAKNGGVIHPETVQKLADINGIRLGVGFLSNIRFMGNNNQIELNDRSVCQIVSNSCYNSKAFTIRLEVLTASFGFLTNFADVYKMWAFIARFLDPCFGFQDRLCDAIDTTET